MRKEHRISYKHNSDASEHLELKKGGSVLRRAQRKAAKGNPSLDKDLVCLPDYASVTKSRSCHAAGGVAKQRLDQYY